MQAYELYFEFERPMFQDLLAHDDSVFHTGQSEQLAHRFRIALARRDAVAVISGPNGTGKTTLAQDSASRTSTRLASTCISQTLKNPDELLEQLLADFGQDPDNLSRVARLQLWRQFLAEMAATDSRVCVIVENAEFVDTDILRALHELTVPHAPQFPGANIVLTTADPEACTRLLDELPALNQRIRLRSGVRPLNANEINDYLDFKCDLAEVSREQVFADDIAEKLHELSGGIIRLLDSLIESGLVLAAENENAPLSAGTIAGIAGDLYEIGAMSPEALDNLLRESAVPVGEPDEFDGADTMTAAANFDADSVIPTLTDYIPATSGIPISHA